MSPCVIVYVIPAYTPSSKDVSGANKQRKLLKKPALAENFVSAKRHASVKFFVRRIMTAVVISALDVVRLLGSAVVSDLLRAVFYFPVQLLKLLL